MKLVPAEVGRAENLVPRSRWWVKGLEVQDWGCVF